MIIPYDYIFYFSSAINEEPQLAVELKGNPREFPGKLVGDNIVGRNPSSIKAFQGPKFAGLKSGEMSVNRLGH